MRSDRLFALQDLNLRQVSRSSGTDCLRRAMLRMGETAKDASTSCGDCSTATDAVP
jgi:hypothetical protein